MTSATYCLSVIFIPPLMSAACRQRICLIPRMQTPFLECLPHSWFSMNISWINWTEIDLINRTCWNFPNTSLNNKTRGRTVRTNPEISPISSKGRDWLLLHPFWTNPHFVLISDELPQTEQILRFGNGTTKHMPPYEEAEFHDAFPFRGQSAEWQASWAANQREAGCLCASASVVILAVCKPGCATHGQSRVALRAN